jgi:hypothetical protein
METEKRPQKRPTRERFLYNGPVIRTGQIVAASGRYFRVVRFWGNHITLEPLTVTEVVEPILATPISIQPEAKR